MDDNNNTCIKVPAGIQCAKLKLSENQYTRIASSQKVKTLKKQ